MRRWATTERKVREITPTVSRPPRRKRVAAYARVSSGKDAMLHSLSAQVSYYSTLIQNKKEWQYVGVYADQALTGTKDDRAEFQRLLADCESGTIDMVITKSVSRFARNTVTLLETVRKLKAIGIDVFFEKENIHSISGDGELMLTILASFAQEESKSVSDNCKWRIRERFKNGELVSLRYMYGYRISRDGIEIDEPEAEVIRSIFRNYIAGISVSEIARGLQRAGVMNPFPRRVRREKPHRSRMRNLHPVQDRLRLFKRPVVELVRPLDVYAHGDCDLVPFPAVDVPPSEKVAEPVVRKAVGDFLYKPPILDHPCDRVGQLALQVDQAHRRDLDLARRAGAAAWLRRVGSRHALAERPDAGTLFNLGVDPLLDPAAFGKKVLCHDPHFIILRLPR